VAGTRGHESLLTSCTGSWNGGNLNCTDAASIGLDCTGYRLPTAVEWEYAARAGDARATYNGELTDTSCADTALLSIAWYCSNNNDFGANGDPNGTKSVATKRHNARGLYDMLGNVWEWTWDHGTLTDFLTNPSGTADPPAVDPFSSEGPKRGGSAAARGATSRSSRGLRGAIAASRPSARTTWAFAWSGRTFLDGPFNTNNIGHPPDKHHLPATVPTEP
jgi:formylglycine-generating enzyme required for sulfatase activity